MNITVYTSQHCNTCEEVIRYFAEKGVDFRQLDVGHHAENFKEMLRLGGIATPFIVIEDNIFHSFDRDKIEQVLQDRL